MSVAMCSTVCSFSSFYFLLQWSPTEDNVFASCSVDGRIAIWDCRENNRAAAAYINAHSTDVNVISWNRLVNFHACRGLLTFFNGF